jgi:hypothetical protein
MPALRLQKAATLGIEIVVSGGFITDNTIRHYKWLAAVWEIIKLCAKVVVRDLRLSCYFRL